MKRSRKGILGDIGRVSVSEALRRGLVAAHSLKLSDLEQWCRLELGGYVASNPSMTTETVIPPYRTVTGQHRDIFGRPLMLSADLAFVGETRLRYGVEELEALAGRRDMLAIHDPDMCELIREHLKVEVYSFHFSVVHLRGVLAAIRTELTTRVLAIDIPEASEVSVGPALATEIFQLRPNFYGIGIVLRALWRRWTGTR